MKFTVGVLAVFMVAACSTPSASLAGSLSAKGIPPYSRAEFGGWGHTEPGCDTRDTVLARDLTATTVRRGCDVVAGTLRDPYTGAVASGRSSRFEVDHIVPLAYMWRGGAWRWTRVKRERAANELTNLRTTLVSVNRSKSDKDVGEWVPRINPCGYAQEFDRIADRLGVADMGRNVDVATACR